MRSQRVRKAIAASLLASLLLGTSACRGGDYDWRWAVPSIIAAFLAGSHWHGGRITQRIERFCFENGVMVDCSQIPNPAGQ